MNLRNKKKDEKINEVFRNCVSRNKNNKVLGVLEMNANAQKEYLDQQMYKENVGGAKRTRVNDIVLYPLPANMGKSLYKHDFNKTDEKAMRNLKSETMNREIESNRMFS